MNSNCITLSADSKKELSKKVIELKKTGKKYKSIIGPGVINSTGDILHPKFIWVQTFIEGEYDES